jgi:nucleoside-diphosphate-sugar epimerase
VEKKKILVAGAGGFIGSHMVKYLKSKGYWIRGVDIKKPEFMQSCADEFLLKDLRSAENCHRVTRDIDQVYNFAANMGGIGFITKVGADIMRDNALININMMEACRKNNVKRIFFSSSACIYPAYRQKTPLVEPLKEEYAVPAEPDQFYGWEKLFTERLMEAYKKDYGLNIRITRYHNIYGPYGTYKGGREKAPAALCRKVAEAKDGGSIVIWGDGEQTRSFLYIDDCVEATYKLMNSGCNEALNIGSDKLITINQLADMIIEISDKRIRKEYDLSEPQGVRGRNADLTRIKNAIDWEPKVSYKKGLDKTYKWILNQVQKMRTHIM